MKTSIPVLNLNPHICVTDAQQNKNFYNFIEYVHRIFYLKG